MKVKETKSTTNESKNEPPSVETKAVINELILRLIGTVTEYKEVNRKARFIIRLGAGRAKVKAHIKILDSNGVILFEKDVDGNAVNGAFGGDGGGITRGLAKEVAKVTLKKFF